MICVTSDTHMTLDVAKIMTDTFCNAPLTRNDYVIIYGDFGGVCFFASSLWCRQRY